MMTVTSRNRSMLGLLLAATTFAVSMTGPAAGQVAPTSPDAPLPALDAERAAADAVQDQAYARLRRARQAQVEMGRPVVAPPVGFWDAGVLADPVVNLNSGLGYMSLQAAINAATAGDTLDVRADLDEGPVTIDRDLFIQGRTGAETVRATQDTGTSGDARGWFLVDADVALIVRDLRFDGNGFKIFQAFRHRGFGLFERVAFEDIQFDPSGPTYQGVAIVAFGGRVDVVESTFEQIGRLGVLFFGGDVVGAIYRGNRYVGKGDGDFLDYAVEVNAGATAWVIDSTISDCRGVASTDGSLSAAVQATTFSGAGTAVSLWRNQLLDNTIGFAAGFSGIGDSTTATAAFNRFFGNGTGLRSASSVATVAENNWWGCNGGPGTVGCDANAVADAGAVDDDPWLVLDASSFRWVKPLGTITLRGEMERNSDSVDLSQVDRVADGIPGTFDPGAVGTLVPTTAASVDGAWRSLFVAGPDEDETTASLTVDNETVETLVRIEIGLFCDGFESGGTGQWGETVPAPRGGG